MRQPNKSLRPHKDEIVTAHSREANFTKAGKPRLSATSRPSVRITAGRTPKAK